MSPQTIIDALSTGGPLAARLLVIVTQIPKHAIAYEGAIPILIAEIEARNDNKQLPQTYLQAIFYFADTEHGALKLIEYGAEPLIKTIAAGTSGFLFVF